MSRFVNNMTAIWTVSAHASAVLAAQVSFPAQIPATGGNKPGTRLRLNV